MPLDIGIPLDMVVEPQFPEAQPPPIAAPPSYVMGGLDCPGCIPDSPQQELQQSEQQSSQLLFLPPRPALSPRQCRWRDRFWGWSDSQFSSQSPQRE